MDYYENTKHEDKEKSMKGGNMDTKNLIIWIVIAVLAVAVIYVFFFRGGATGNVTGALDTTGWTENEKMNYEMHGTIPARLEVSGASAGSSGGMVGGC